MSVFKDDDARQQFVDYFFEELALCEAERAPKLRDFQRYRDQRMAIPDKKKRNWPWKKASNICTPLALINTNGTFGTLKSTFGVTNPRVTVSSKRQEFEEATKAFNSFLDIYIKSPKRININEVDNTILYDCGSLGTQFVRVAWDKDVFNLKRRDSEGNVVTREITRRNSPAIIPYRIEDVFTRVHFTNIHTAPWVATRCFLHEHELKQRAAKGIYVNIDELVEKAALTVNEAKQAENTSLGFSPNNETGYEVFEVNVFWDVDGDGVFEDIKVWVERKSQVIIREEFNELGKRDLVRIPYVHIPYSVYALGVGSIVDHMQQEADTLHNLRINQQLMALCPALKMKQGSTAVGDEGLRPGKIFRVEAMDDIEEFRTHDLSSLAFESEMVVREYAGQATSINNSLLGLPDVYAKSRGTSSGYMMQAQQSIRQFTSSVVENIKTGYVEIFNLIVLQMIMNKNELDWSLVDDKDKNLIEMILSVNPEDFLQTFAFEVNITEQDQTDEAKKQARIMLVQFYTQYGQQLMQLAQIMDAPQASPNMKNFAARLLVGATKIMDEIFDDFGKSDESAYLPFLADLEFLLKQWDMQKLRGLGQAVEMMNNQQGGGQMLSNPMMGGNGNYANPNAQ